MSKLEGDQEDMKNLVEVLKGKEEELKKELQEKECQKLSNEVQQKVIYRKELEATALKLTSQLEQITKEKQDLAQEHQNNLVSPLNET